MTFGTQEVERKTNSILKILKSSRQPLGARVIARQLMDYGVDLGERAVRYHLKLMDERGLTCLVGRDGRLITEKGVEELSSALVNDKVGLAISRIEQLAFRTNFDWKKRRGIVPVNLSLIPKRNFRNAVIIIKRVINAGVCVSNLVKVAEEGEQLGELIVPQGYIALATVCSIVINGTLLKAGVPMDSRFGGILQMRDNRPMRFSELIHYAGCSLDPTEVFIRAGMTSVLELVKKGKGTILANFRDIPAICRPVTEEVIDGLRDAKLGGMLLMGNTSEPICEIPVELNRVGIILIGGLNPVAAVEESGIKTVNHAMSTVIDYQELVDVKEL